MTSSTTPHWKASQTAEGDLGLSLWTKRLLGVVVVVGAVVLLVRIVWPKAQIKPYVFTVSVPAFDEESLLPVAYLSGDVAALNDLAEYRFAGETMEQPEAGQTTADNIRAYINRHLQERRWNEKDIVVLYLLTHGISLPGEAPGGRRVASSPREARPAERGAALLAGSRFQFASDVATPPSGSLRLKEDVLDPASACTADTTLVVLDVNRIPTLPSRGMFINDLANHIHSVLQGGSDDGGPYSSDLWVIVPNGPFEAAAMDDEARRSTFNAAFEEALRGEADGRLGEESDDHVSVGELYAYVRDRVRATSPGQTVLLFQGGKGVVQDDAALADSPILVSTYNTIPSADPDDDEQAVDAAESKAKTAERNETETSSGTSQQAPQPAAEGAPGPSERPSPVSDTVAAAPTASSTPGVQESSGGKSGQTADGSATATDTASAADAAGTSSATPAGNGAAATAGTSPPATAADEAADQKRVRRPQFTHQDDVWKRAWQLQKYLLSRDTHGSWSPVDFAPIVWRDTEAELAKLELLLELKASDGDKAPAELRSRVETIVDQWMELAVAMDEGRVPSAAAVRRNRLLQAWQALLQSDAHASWQAAQTFVERHRNTASNAVQDEINRVDQRMRDLRRIADATYAVGEFVALLDAASACGVADSHLETFGDDLMAYLEVLNMVAKEASAAQGIARTDQMLRLDRHAENLERHRSRAALFLAPWRTSGALSPIALVALQKTDDSLSVHPRNRWSIDGGANERRAAEVASGAGRRLQKLASIRANVYQRYLDLARFDEPGIAAFPQASSSAREASSLLPWARSVGRHLSVALDAVADGVDPSGEGLPDLLLAHRCRLVDVETIRERALQGTRTYVPPPAIELPDRLFLTVEEHSEEAPLRLRFGSPREVLLRTNTYGSAPVDEKLRVTYREDLLEVRHAQQVLGNGTTIALQPGEAAVSLQVVARRRANAAADLPNDQPVSAADVTVSVVDGTRSHEPVTLRCRLPLERPFRLAANQWLPLPERPPSGEWFNPVRLRPYPNRKTTFPLTLQNLSREPKTVDVELYAAAVQQEESLKRFRQYHQENGMDVDVERRREEFLGRSPELIGSVSGLEILAGGQSDPLVFAKEPDKAAKEPMPEGDASTSGAGSPGAGASDGTSNSDKDTQPKTIHVGQGMICVVKQTEPIEDEWLYFIEVDPLVPTDFLTADVNFTRKNGRLAVEITVSPKDGFPGSGNNPLLVKFSNAKENAFLQQQRGSNPQDQIAPGKPAALWFDVGDRESEWRVLIDVGSKVGDDEVVFYERAIDLRITDQGGGNLAVEELREVRSDVQIESLSMTRSGEDGQPQPIGFYAPDSLEDAAFDVEQKIAEPPPTIDIQFHVDATDTAFNKYQDNVTLQAGSDRSFVRYSDREIGVTVVDGEEPALTLETRVEDFEHAWQPTEKDTKVPIKVVLTVEDDGQPKVQTNETSVKLDVSAPQITSFNVDKSGAQRGAPPIIEIRARDNLTAVTLPEVGQDKNGNGRLEEDEKLELPLIESRQDGPTSGTWKFEFPQNLATPRASVSLLARVVDRVGHSSTRSTSFVMPVIAEQTAPEPKKGMIWGVVSFNGNPKQGITVKLRGPVEVPDTVTGGNGKYAFGNLPAGNYVLEAEGTVDLAVEKGAELVGQQAVRGFNPDRNPRHREHRVNVSLRKK